MSLIDDYVSQGDAHVLRMAAEVPPRVDHDLNGRDCPLQLPVHLVA